MSRITATFLFVMWGMLSHMVPLFAYTTKGVLTHDEVWEGKILLTGDVVVPPGLTLTIRPGTQVRYPPGVREMKVFGTLNLEGELAHPVQFIEQKEANRLATSSIQTIQIEPVNTEPLRQEVKAFTNQYLILWTILSFGWFYALNNR